MGARELSSVLWEERQLLDLLVFKLEEESLVLASGRHHWLERATSEVEFVLGRIQELEATREALARDLGTELSIGETPSLAEIADVVPEPWAGTFRDHRKALQGVLARTQDVAHHNREVLARYVVAVSDALSILGSTTGTSAGPAYAADGRVSADQGRVTILDAVG